MARKQAQKQLKDPTPIIVGAGITEQWYFKHLQKLRKYRVKIRPRYFGRENAFELDKRVDIILKDEALPLWCLMPTLRNATTRNANWWSA